MHITGLHHVAIIASDYARSRDFYCRILGLKMIAENWRADRQSWKLDLALPGGGQLELFSFPAPPPRPTRPEACGLRHLALATADAEAARAHLRDRGVSVEALRMDEYTGARFFFCADPDGLPIEFYQAAPAA
ncbi:VOC family protein [Chromobacterium violaceum]|uniref:SMU1112c/YaeR family gloxylase I-like metalloprotein n=1 Tax=Chromobacterium violaceum TaxID=536 RepID=UPI001BE7EA96|nr:VOC family protein [Chromobacterium violaceum]MBT2869177.1 VOC family protein [Chromobacterium violaceum]